MAFIWLGKDPILGTIFFSFRNPFKLAQRAEPGLLVGFMEPKVGTFRTRYGRDVVAAVGWEMLPESSRFLGTDFRVDPTLLDGSCWKRSHTLQEGCVFSWKGLVFTIRQT